MAEWYRKADQLYKEVVTEVRKVFRKSRLTLPFDEINARKMGTIATKIYTVLYKLNKRKYCDLCDYLWEEAWLEAVGIIPGLEDVLLFDSPREQKDYHSGIDRAVKWFRAKYDVDISKEYPAINREVVLSEEPESSRSEWRAERRPGKTGKPPKFNAEKFVEKQLRTAQPNTGYVYDNEVERKRDRFFESVLSHAEEGSRRGVDEDYTRAENLWNRQTEQGFIDTEDALRKEAYKTSGVQLVRWDTERDERVCEECQAMDGLIFPIDRVPSKPHPRCRCRVTPVR